MDSIDTSLRISQQAETCSGMASSQSVHSTLYEDISSETFLNSSSSPNVNTNVNGQHKNSKFANLLKLYEYQIIEMQHEYELLLEDKVR